MTTKLRWTLQGLRAALFLFAGIFKLILPTHALEQQAHMSGVFLKFIGLCETLGALGLILPGIFRVRGMLTPLAAAGLLIIMTGATVITMNQGQAGISLFSAVVGVLCAIVAWGRWRRPVAAAA